MQDSEKPFENLGFTGWFRLVFLTRAQTIKQCDHTIALLMQGMDEVERDNQRLRKMAPLVSIQHEALLEAQRAFLPGSSQATAKLVVDDAIKFAEQSL